MPYNSGGGGGAGGGGASINMPMTSAYYNNTYIKTAIATREGRRNSGFWSHFGESDSPGNWRGAKYTGSWSANQEETIINISDTAGTLTHVLCPVQGTAAKQRVTVIADGVTHLFERHIPALYSLFVGQFDTVGLPNTTSSYNDNITIHGYKDAGWSTNGHVVCLRNPDTTLATTNIGIPFEESLVVKIKVFGAARTGLYERYAGVAYVER